MVFKNFRINSLIRLALLAASFVLLFYLIFESTLYATIFIVLLAIIFQFVAFIHYIEKTNRDIARFLLSIRHSDFSQSFTGSERGGSYDELQLAFTEVIKQFHKARLEKEEHFRYLQTVIQHIAVGLLAFQPDGRVELINTAAKRLLGSNRLDNLRKLDPEYGPLVEKLYHLEPGQNSLFKFDKPSESMQLSIYATEFKMRDKNIKLVSMQNIRSELGQREMQAWQQLVRVLTHEIMNSVTPISSLASTVGEMLETGNGRSGDMGRQRDTETVNDIRTAITTIEKRSRGLLSFVDTYRKLTRIPTPKYQVISVRELFERIMQLMGSLPDADRIEFAVRVEPQNLQLNVDPDLIEQVLLNLIKNAVQALDGQPEARIELSGSIDSLGIGLIQVTDNGPGIEKDVMEKIFVPFYSSKSDGSGIGLNISRQIMHLHKGDLTAFSDPGKRTTFTLRF